MFRIDRSALGLLLLLAAADGAAAALPSIGLSTVRAVRFGQESQLSSPHRAGDRFASAFAIAAITHSGLARAETSDAVAAQALFDQARALMTSGKASEACPKFAESQRLDPGVGTLLNLAACYEASGRPASAWSTFLEAESAARAASNVEGVRVSRERAAALH